MNTTNTFSTLSYHRHNIPRNSKTISKRDKVKTKTTHANSKFWCNRTRIENTAKKTCAETETVKTKKKDHREKNVTTQWSSHQINLFFNSRALNCLHYVLLIIPANLGAEERQGAETGKHLIV